MGSPDPKEILENTVRDLTQLASDLAWTKAEAGNRLSDPEYAALRSRLENAHAAVESALI